MPAQPPPLPPQKNLRFASALNVLLPGAGLFYLGRRRTGSLLAIAFILCFLALCILFLVGYGNYLSILMSENLLEGNKLEQAGESLHQRWLLGLAIAGLFVYAGSAILFSREKRRFGG